MSFRTMYLCAVVRPSDKGSTSGSGHIKPVLDRNSNPMQPSHSKERKHRRSLHTGLYYCPGAEPFGETPGGKLTTQSQARQEHFKTLMVKSVNDAWIGGVHTSA